MCVCARARSGAAAVAIVKELISWSVYISVVNCRLSIGIEYSLEFA